MTEARTISLDELIPATRARVPLAEVLEMAPATTRVDRKYIVPVDSVRTLVDDLPAAYRVLEVGKRITTNYRSTYFDTDELETVRWHVQQRPRRWKARSRLYVEDGFCRLEIKSRDGRGVTSKILEPMPIERYGVLDDGADELIDERVRALGFAPVEGLRPVLEVEYRRTTLADTDSGSRLTIDTALRAHRVDQDQSPVVTLDDNHAIVETKGGRRPGEADRLLTARGHRPISFSKYAASVAFTDDRLADNDWRRHVGDVLHLDPHLDSHLDSHLEDV